MSGFMGKSGFLGGQMDTPAPRMPNQMGGLGAPPMIGKLPGAGGPGGGFALPGQTQTPQMPPVSNPFNKIANVPGQTPAPKTRRQLPTPRKTSSAAPETTISTATQPVSGGIPEIPMPVQGPTQGTLNPSVSSPFTPTVQGPPPGTPGTIPFTPTVQGPPPGTPGTMSGVQTAWDMGAGANRGQVRTNPQTGQQEILMGAGGGEQYQWVPYDPNNYGQKQNADLFSRYGSNWTSGSGATSMHSADIAQVLREQLGREPTMYEIYDVYYGKNRGVSGIPYNGGVSGQ